MIFFTTECSVTSLQHNFCKLNFSTFSWANLKTNFIGQYDVKVARPRQSSGNASEQKFTRNVLLIDDTVRLTTKSQKSAYEEAKIMQHCINVKSSGNDICDIYREKGRSQKKRNATCNKKLHSWPNWLKRFKIVKNPLTKNTLNQNPYKRSEKYYTNMYQENSLQLTGWPISF